jgi:hypothetical protein
MKLRNLRDIMVAHRAIKRVALPLVNRPSALTEPMPEVVAQRSSDDAEAAASGLQNPSQVDVGIRVLTGLEWATVYEKAGEFARERKVPDEQLNDRNPIYNLGCSVYTCVLACVDPDSAAADPDPFFGERGDLESAALELLSSPHIGRDGIQFLTEAQQVWQDRCSPTALRLPPDQLLKQVAELASESDEVSSQAFLGMRPGMQWLCMRFMATQLRNFPILNSLFSSSSLVNASKSASEAS